jgi:hypothetical protein
VTEQKCVSRSKSASPTAMVLLLFLIVSVCESREMF